MPSDSARMTAAPPAPPPRWRFRLQLLTGAAVLVVLVMLVRAQSARASLDQRRQVVQGALRALVSAQQEHYARTGTYALALDAGLEWRRPASVVVRFRAEGDQAWHAVATDSMLTVPPTTCGVFLGDQSLAPHRAVIAPGTVACW